MVEFLMIFAGAGVAFACMMFYRRGLKDGLSAARGEEPSPLRLPAKETVDETQEEYAKKAEMYLNYDPYNPPKGEE